MMILVCLFMLGSFYSQVRLSAFPELEQKQKVMPRHTFVLIHTDWCQYCKAMKTVLKNKKISKILNDHFYTLLLNAEERKDIKFAGRVFRFHPTGVNTGTHELAQMLAEVNGQMSYPSIVILNPKNEIVFQYAGFLDAKALEQILMSVDKKH